MKKRGEPSPDFVIPLPGGMTQDLGGVLRTHHVVLSFYPRDFSFGCTRQMCAFRNRFEEFTVLGATVIGVSRDAVATHRDFSATHQLSFPLVSDEDGMIARAFGVKSVDKVVSLHPRVTFVIARGGIIHAVIRHNLRFKKHVEDALRELQTLPRDPSHGTK
jgi:thioredoxin-dependent peroxiredoxin